MNKKIICQYFRQHSKWLIIALVCIIVLIVSSIFINHIKSYNNSEVYISIFDLDEKNTQPDKINIYIDAIMVGRNTSTYGTPRFNVTPDKHKLKITAAGYEDVIYNFRAKGDGEELYFSFTMKKLTMSKKP